jgi:hypothetical protein
MGKGNSIWLANIPAEEPGLLPKPGRGTALGVLSPQCFPSRALRAPHVGADISGR